MKLSLCLPSACSSYSEGRDIYVRVERDVPVELVRVRLSHFLSYFDRTIVLGARPLFSGIERGIELNTARQVHLHVDVEARLYTLLLVGAHVVRNEVALRWFTIGKGKERSDKTSYMKGQDSRLLTKVCAAFFSSSQQYLICGPSVIYHPSEFLGDMQ